MASMVKRADQLPGKDAYDRFGELETKINALVPEWEKLTREKMEKVSIDILNK